MEDKNNIDDFFRSGLDDFKMDPPEKSWDSIKQELDKKQALKKGRNGLTYLSIALLLIFVGYVTYKINTGSDKSAIVNQGPTVSEDLKNNEPSSIKGSNNISANATEKNPNSGISNSNADNVKPTSQNVQNPAEKNSENKFIQPPAFSQSVNVNSTNSKSDNKSVTNTSSNRTENNSVQENKSEVNADHAKNKTNSVASISNSNENNPQIIVSTYDEEDNLSNNSSSCKDEVVFYANKENSTNEVETKNNPEVVVNSENSKTDPAKVTSVSVLDPTEKPNDVTSVATVMAVASNPSAPSAPPTEPAKINSENSTKTEANFSSMNSGNSTLANGDYSGIQKSDSTTSFFKSLLSHLSAEIYFSPDYVSSRLKVNDSYTGSASQDINDYNNQQAAFSYSTGINARYDLGEKWSIGSGVSYSTFNQTAVYNTINVISDSLYRKEYRHPPMPTQMGGMGNNHGGNHGGHNPHVPPGNNSHHYVIQTPCGAIDLYNEPPHHNSGNHHDGDTLNIKTETTESLQFINVPLTIRYQFGKNKFSYFVEGGAAINFVKGDKVQINVEDAYTETNEHDGLKSTSYSLLFGAGAQYNFYKGLRTFVKPSFRYSITPVNQNNPMYSYPYYIGVEVGFSIHF